jgi:hypothetical protein
VFSFCSVGGHNAAPIAVLPPGGPGAAACGDVHIHAEQCVSTTARDLRGLKALQAGRCLKPTPNTVFVSIFSYGWTKSGLLISLTYTLCVFLLQAKCYSSSSWLYLVCMYQNNRRNYTN